MGPPHGAAETPSSAATEDRSSLHHRERSSLVKNRMREICSSGSVRGGGGNVPTYSAQGVLADVELAGIVADDDRLMQEPVCGDCPPQCALGGDAHRVGGHLQIGDAELLQMALSKPPDRRTAAAHARPVAG